MEGITVHWRERHDGVEHPCDVLFFVVSRDDDEAIGHSRKIKVGLEGHAEHVELFAVEEAPMASWQVFFG